MTTNYHEPTALGASKAAIEKFAEELAEQINFAAGDSIEELVQRTGGRLIVGTSGFGDEESGSIVAREVNDFEIYISRHTSLKRDRFTIAHELGHLLLHFGDIKKDSPESIMRATRYVNPMDREQQRAEWEANWFASAFLMPSNEFKSAYNNDGVEAAAALCGVSLSAAKIRAQNLQLN